MDVMSNPPTLASGVTCPVAGPMCCPFALWDRTDGTTVQVTFSKGSEGDVTIKSIVEYPTPPGRLCKTREMELI